MEIPKHPELTALAKEYASARDARMACGRVEKTHKDALMVKMHALGLEIYEDPDDDVLVEIEQEEKLTVKVGKTKSNGNGAEPDSQ
jgi:hypothetical protein